jgi:CRISPR system Cascade subunit CasE
MADLHLIKVLFRADGLIRIARRRNLPIRQLDEGYLAHAVLRELWQEYAPTPFLLRGHGRNVEAWGYSALDSEALREHAAAFGDPMLIEVLDGGVEAIASKQMPSFSSGRRVGFLIRVCPIVRLANGRGAQKGREVDAFLAKCWQVGPDVTVSREDVYRTWFEDRMNPERAGARIERVAVDSHQRERFVRRMQPTVHGDRPAKTIERPDVRLSGELLVKNPVLFGEVLRRGIGRHKAFGFGMLLLVPPGRTWEAPGEARRGGAHSC